MLDRDRENYSRRNRTVAVHLFRPNNGLNSFVRFTHNRILSQCQQNDLSNHINHLWFKRYSRHTKRIEGQSVSAIFLYFVRTYNPVVFCNKRYHSSTSYGLTVISHMDSHLNAEPWHKLQPLETLGFIEYRRVIIKSLTDWRVISYLLKSARYFDHTWKSFVD